LGIAKAGGGGQGILNLKKNAAWGCGGTLKERKRGELPLTKIRKTREG